MNVGICVGVGKGGVADGTGLAGAVSLMIVGDAGAINRGSRLRKKVARAIANPIPIRLTTTPSPSHSQGIGSR